MPEKLAILGGVPLTKKPFKRFNQYADDEAKAALEVVKTGVLSKFLGVWHEDFYGGPQVRQLGENWQRLFETKHAVAVNSATSGLIAAVGAIGVEPGDEVIVSPWTMSATAT